MARDYAKRYKTAPKKRKKASLAARARSFFVCIIILAIFGGGIASYVYYHQQHTITVTTSAKNEPVKPVAAPVADAEEDPVNYEFYTLLPKINVPDPKLNTAPPDEQPGFWLQLMVYYSMRDASAFVDRLQLSGLDPVITQRKSNKTDHDLFIVVLGPFSTKENAVARQQDLKKMSISSYVFHVDPPVVNIPPPNVSASSNDLGVPVSDAIADPSA